MKAKIVKRKRKSRVEQLMLAFSTFVVVLSMFGIVITQSMISTLNVEKQKEQAAVAKLEKINNNLDMQKQELISFDRVAPIARAQGLEMRNDGTVMWIQAQGE